MRVLLTGADGQLGQHLRRCCPDPVELISSGRVTGDRPCDLTDQAAVRRMLDQVRPELVLNAAAWTAVDAAEDHPTEAFALNAELPDGLADWCHQNDAALITYSTDYVFGGSPGRPWREDDACQPDSVYGRSKRAGELSILNSAARALIIRTAWVYSALPGNFLSAILARAAVGQSLRVVDDQTGSPTWAGTLAEASWQLAKLGPEKWSGPELVHVAGTQAMSWHRFAELALKQAVSAGLIDQAVPVEAISSDEWPQKARRPNWSVLDCSRYSDWTGQTLASVEQALEDCTAQWTTWTTSQY